MTSAKIIKDSISPAGHRLITMEVTLHRFVLAEFNTHRVFSRNSASSRAIPVEKTLGRVRTDPALPLSMPREQPGMQGGAELEGDDLYDALYMINRIHFHNTQVIEDYLRTHPDKATRLHKSVLNRYLEPFMWHTIVVTSTEWQNFFDQRCHPDAQPEIRAAADLMRQAYEQSTPQAVGFGKYHLPYITDEDRTSVKEYFSGNVAATIRDWDDVVDETLRMISVARCARVSTLNHDGKRSIEDDLKLYERLTTAKPPHASPLEHVATPMALSDPVPLGNFEGWHQLRHLI